MTNIASYRKQETALILLNMGVLAALFFVHISFLSLLGQPSRLLMAALTVRFVILIFELLWIQRLSEHRDRRAITVHIYLSIILNIAVAFIASTTGATADSHYSVLMIIPIISAAFRFDLVRTLVVAALAIGLNFLEVWLFYRANPPVDITEYFEAATVSLIFLVVAVIVWLLVGNLRSEEQKLNKSLDEQRRLQEKLVAEEKLAIVGQLSSAIAHEIRNPVTMIASSLRMAADREPGSDIQREMFNIATDEAKRLEDLTTDFLAFARNSDPDIRPANICDLLNYIASLIKARMIEKGLELDVVCPGALVFDIDASQMEQAMLNLLTNAINATPKGRRISIGAERRDDGSVLFVVNEGGKIDDDIAAKIFEPFFTRGAAGTGLGLSIVRNIARAHRGDVYLSHNENGKVRFEIVF